MVRRGALAGVALATAALLAAGCGGGTRSATPPKVKDLGGCLSRADGRLSRYHDSDVTAAVAVLGHGRSGVVISYESDGSVCSWKPLAERLVSAGLSVLLYDRLAGSPGDFVPAMVRVLRRSGVRDVGLVGGSIGGIASLARGPRVRPPMRVIVSLSGADTSTVLAARDVTVPLLVVCARGDTTFFAAARSTVQAAESSPDRRFVPLSGNAHASSMFAVDGTLEQRVAVFVEQALVDPA